MPTPCSLFTARENVNTRFAAMVRSLGAAVFGLVTVFALSGCVTDNTANTQPTTQVATGASPEMLNLKEGDVIKVTFPGVPGMDTQQTVRQDGRITLPIIGEYVVVGKTTDALSKELRVQYDSQLISKEVNVTLLSSACTVYVTGAVLRPGKIVSDRKLSAFEAIMEAGGYDPAKANLKEVLVLREENGQNRSYTVNLQEAMNGTPSAPFYLKPFDKIIVPVKFNWF
ncbi:MAG: polysaccharide biosynthesis/export family protein [Opitutaceae bacterium]